MVVPKIKSRVVILGVHWTIVCEVIITKCTRKNPVLSTLLYRRKSNLPIFLSGF